MQDKVTTAKYLKERLRRLGACNSEIENRLKCDEIEFINSCGDDGAAVTYLSHIEDVVANTFRYSMLIAACTFLEEAVKAICGLSVTGYEKMAARSGRGTWLEKHRRLLAAEPSVDLAAIADELARMEEFIQVRNCIVHAWGNVQRCRNSQALERIVECVGKSAEEDDTLPHFALSADGFICVEDDAVAKAIWASGAIVERLLQDLVGMHASIL
jgi:hypothetical protein